MKRGILLITGLCLTILTFAQDSAIDKYFSEYNNDDSFTKIEIAGKMFQLFAEVEATNADEQALLNTMSKLKSLKILFADSVPDSKTFYRNALKKPSAEFDVLMTFKDNTEDFTFLIKEKNGIIKELLLMISGPKEFCILDLVGEIKLSEIASLAEVMNIDGFEHFKHLEKAK